MEFAARIDVHQHIVPPVWARALEAADKNPGGWAIPAWSRESAIAMMDQQGIATGVLSTPAPGVHLGADGVILLSNAHGRYLGDPGFEPLWAELNRRAAVVFVHPVPPPLPMLPGTPAPLVDYVFDTTRTAVNLVLNRVMGRYPDVKVILSHGGGFLPYAAYRFAGLTATVTDPGRTADSLLRDFKRFYFDTALAASPTALPALLAFAEPGHVLYGSDWPFAPKEAGTYYNHFLETYPGFTPGQAEAINRTSAEALLPRLAN